MDGTAIKVTDIYDMFRHCLSTQSRWCIPIPEVFHQQFSPNGVQCVDVVAGFAREHKFETYDMTDRLSKIHTMADLVKFYSTCCKLALSKPNTLFFVAPTLDVPHSLTVVEGLFALRASLIAGSLHIFFRDRKNATPREKELMRTRVYDLFLWQADNIVLLSNNTTDEMRRKLSDLVTECSICLEPLTDTTHGSITYPYRCEHAFHCMCVEACTECPLCRNAWKSKKIVYRVADATRC
jgi:hypothetical protein